MSILISFYSLMSYKSNKSDNRIQFYCSIRHENMVVSNIKIISDINGHADGLDRLTLINKKQ
jgi:hypothetical protein